MYFNQFLKKFRYDKLPKLTKNLVLKIETVNTISNFIRIFAMIQVARTYTSTMIIEILQKHNRNTPQRK